MSGRRTSAISLVLLGLASLLAIACRPATIEATLTRDVNDKNVAVQPTTSFTSGDPQIRAVARILNAAPETPITGQWVLASVKGRQGTEAKIGAPASFSSRDNLIVFTLPAGEGGFPAAEYRIDLYLGNDQPNGRTPDKSLTFSVAGPTVRQALLAEDNAKEGQADGARFPAGTDIVLEVVPQGSLVDTKISARWTAVQVSGVEKDRAATTTPYYQLNEAKKYIKLARLRNPFRLLPQGDYRVDVFFDADTTPATSLRFTAFGVSVGSIELVTKLARVEPDPLGLDVIRSSLPPTALDLSCRFTVSGLPRGSKSQVRVRWTKFDAGTREVNRIDEESLTLQVRGDRREYPVTRPAPFALSDADYLVEVFLNEETTAVQSKSFRIRP